MTGRVLGNIHRDDGPVTEVSVRPSTWAKSAGFPGNGLVKTLALFDTGSEATFIQSGLAEELGLNPVDVDELVTLSGVIRCNVFDVDILFADSEIVVPNLCVAEADMESYAKLDVGVILGRSLLRKGTFGYHGFDEVFEFRLGGSSLPERPRRP